MVLCPASPLGVQAPKYDLVQSTEALCYNIVFNGVVDLKPTSYALGLPEFCFHGSLCAAVTSASTCKHFHLPSSQRWHPKAYYYSSYYYSFYCCIIMAFIITTIVITNVTMTTSLTLCTAGYQQLHQAVAEGF